MKAVRYSQSELENVLKRAPSSVRHRLLNEAGIVPESSAVVSDLVIPKPAHKLGRGRGSYQDGYYFPSMAELRRYQYLKTLSMAGAIAGLSVHPSWDIVVNDVPICRVIMDFSYTQNGVFVVEDVKAVRVDSRSGKEAFTTDTYLSKIKRKLLKSCYPIEPRLVVG